MSGNSTGGAKATATIKATNPNHYREMGMIGGKSNRGGLKGFASPKHRLYGKAGEAGKIGGKISRRPKGARKDAAA